MQQFFYFFIRFKIFWVFVLLEVGAMILLFSGSPYHSSGYFNTANAITGNIFGAYNSVNRYFHLGTVNDSLAAENARLHTSFYNLDTTIHPTDTVEFNDTASNYVGRYCYIAADVISNSTSKSNNYLMLNVGSVNGVTRQSGVVCSGGVVGIVYDVSEHFCTVISVLSSNSKISAKIDKTNNSGILTWNGKSPLYGQIDDINKHVKVEAGQTISTSGLNIIFPRNIPVGVVEETKIVDNSNNIKVKLSTPFESLYKVYVVKNLDAEEQQKLIGNIK